MSKSVKMCQTNVMVSDSSVRSASTEPGVNFGNDHLITAIAVQQEPGRSKILKYYLPFLRWANGYWKIGSGFVEQCKKYPRTDPWVQK